MSEIDPGGGETESTDPTMDVIAMVTTEDSRSEGHSALDRVATEFVEDELAVRRMADAPRSDIGGQPFEVRAD
ncbi:MAG: hypothetical protein BRD24_09920, partial [Halobacteriales archaeon SW_9_67_24]